MYVYMALLYVCRKQLHSYNTDPGIKGNSQDYPENPYNIQEIQNGFCGGSKLPSKTTKHTQCKQKVL